MKMSKRLELFFLMKTIVNKSIELVEKSQLGIKD